MPYDDSQEGKMPPKALAAFTEYKLMGPTKRSMPAMAKKWVKLNPAGVSGKAKADPVLARERQLERWSKRYDWVRLVKEWDEANRRAKVDAYIEADEAMDDNLAKLNQGLLGLTSEALKDLLEEDKRRRGEYQKALKAWKPGKPRPKFPKPLVGAFILQQIAFASQAEWRAARESLLARYLDDSEDPAAAQAGLPQVFEVFLTPTPPPEPMDPRDVVNALPPEYVPALPVGLTTTRPPNLDEDTDEDE